MKRILLSIFFAALLISCNTKPEEESFTLTGTITNVPDSSMVYMDRGNTRIDSAMVMREKFSFTGKVEEPYSVYLMLPGSSEYTTVWLENSEIELSAEKGKFSEAVITGSEAQKEEDRLYADILPLRRARDSANAAISEKGKLSETEKKSATAYFTYLERKQLQTYHNFIRENPGSVVSAYMLNFYKTTWGKKTTEGLFAYLPEERRKSSDGKMISRFLELNQNPDVGDAYADFEMTNGKGEVVKLSEMRGKYTLLHFWAANCYYSQQTNPGLVKNYEMFKDRGFEIVGVSNDEDPKLFSKHVKEQQLTWTNLLSPEGDDNDAALIYGISGTPDNFLIDENGIIIARNIRGEKLTQKLEELMPPTETAQL